MPELVGFQDSRSGFRARDFSPDSVIFTADQSSSNFSLFSSASASVERCSFASDAPDQDSVSSALSRHSASGGHELSEALSGPDPDPDKPSLIHRNSFTLRRKDKTKVERVDSSEAETTEDENIATASARNSFSQALKECQDRKLRRPSSIDLNSSLNNVTINSSPSPRLGTSMNNKQSATTIRKTGTFPSPGTPNFRQATVGAHKGWSSERVPLHANASRRNLNTPLLPYNSNGRTLPSKWEDAERWIFSPVEGGFRTSAQQAQRKPKSKSGPLGPPGVAYYQMFSPAGQMHGGGGQNGKLTANFSFSQADMMNADGMGTEPCMARSISIHGYSERLSSQLPLPENQDDVSKDDSANNISRAVSRRDMATQMSPGSSSIQSSPRRHSSFSAILPVVDSGNTHFKKSEIRDVPVDERVTMTRWSKNSRGGKSSGRGSRNAVNIHSAGWEVSTETSMIKREEAKITAWENLQKAKAEAAIRKLEMKLEKKRSSSMDKIMNKLKSAQKKAQDMRSSTMQVGHQTSRTSDRALLPSRRTRPIRSLSGCFTCHAF